MKYSSSKEFDVLVRQLLRQGWSFSRGKKHGELRPPMGHQMLIVPGTPSDIRAILNFRRDLRHASMF